MLTTLQVVLYSVLVLISPVILYAVISGGPPEAGPFARFYRADKWLYQTGNVFVLLLCAIAAFELAVHFGFVTTAGGEAARPYFMGPFGFLLLVYLALWVRAAIRVRRDQV